MPTKHTYTCAHCQKEFWSYEPPHRAPKNCSPECAKAQRTAHLHKIRNVVKPIINTCEVCGCRFIGRIKYKSYRACSAPECRLEMRKRVGRESAKTVLKKQQERGLMRPCNVCQNKFLAPNKFIWTCPECKNNRDANTTGATWWGAVI